MPVVSEFANLVPRAFLFLLRAFLLRAKALVNAGQILPDFGSIFESH